MTTKAITGLQGEGKTHLAMQWIRDAVKAGRPVHTNIEGIKLEGVEEIPENDMGELDWQLCPPADADEGTLGALVIYDEAQKLKDKNGKKYFAYVNREKLSPRDVISELDEHRHFGYDIVFITQEANLLHLHLLSLIKEHYHCSRPHNRSDGSQVGLWRSMQKMPNSATALERAEDVYFSKFDPEIFKLYKSTEAVTDGKTRYPKYLKKLLFIGIFCIVSIIVLFIFVDNPMFNLKAMSALKGDKEGIEEMSKYMPPGMQKAQEEFDKASKTIQLDAKSDLSIECRKGANVEKPECVKWFNDLSKSGGSAGMVMNNQPVKTISYNPNSPFDDADIIQNLSYEVSAKPVFSGCTQFNGQYMAYTQQGTRLKVSASDCKRLINDADRPFNYFAKEQQNRELSKPETNKDEESSEYKKAFIENRARLDAEKMYLAKNADVKHEPLPIGSKAEYFDSSGGI